MNLEEKFKELNINYEKVEHPAVYTVEEAKEKVPKIDGVGCKNLFLKTQKKEHFLYTLPEDKQVNLKKLSDQLGVTRFHFASPETLESVLGVIPGSVTPLAITNDTEFKVTVVWKSTATEIVNSNKKATYVCINYGESFCPDEIKKQAILISGDIDQVINDLLLELEG